MGINYNARKITQTVSLSILDALFECNDLDTTCEKGLDYDDANFSFNDEKVFFNYGVGINKLVGEKYLIGLEYSRHRLLVIKLGYNF